MQLGVASGSFVVGCFILLDVFLGPHPWNASISLALSSDISQTSTAILMLGGAPTVFGILFRPRKWEPIASVLLEALGWLSTGAGLLSFAISVVAHNSNGYAVSASFFGLVAVGAFVESKTLFCLASESLRKVQRNRETEERLRKLHGRD